MKTHIQSKKGGSERKRECVEGGWLAIFKSPRLNCMECGNAHFAHTHTHIAIEIHSDVEIINEESVFLAILAQQCAMSFQWNIMNGSDGI